MIRHGLSTGTVAQPHGDDIQLSGGLHLFRQHIRRQILNGASPPVAVQRLQNLCAVLRCNIIRIGIAHREFVNVRDIPVAGLVFREQVGAPVLVCRRTDDQFVLHDQRGHPAQYIPRDLTAEDRRRIARILLVRLCCQHQPFRCDTGTAVEVLFPHSCQSFIQHFHSSKRPLPQACRQLRLQAFSPVCTKS